MYKQKSMLNGLAASCLVAAMALAWPAFAQQGCQIRVDPDQSDSSQHYITAWRNADTLTHAEIDAEIRRIYRHTAPTEPPQQQLIRYRLPPQPGVPQQMFAFVSAGNASPRHVFTSAFIPASQPVEPTATAMCAQLAQVKIPWERPSSRPRDRTAPPDIERKPMEVIAPATPFYLYAARDALLEGDATITGPACVIHMGRIQFPGDMPVFLYPVSPYTEQVVAMENRASKSKGRQVVRIAEGFLETRLEGRTNSEGHFRFSRLKPGRYYLVAQVQSSFYGEQEVSVASYTNAYGFKSYINQMQGYTKNFDDTLEKFVDIKPGQTQVKVHLTPRGLGSVFGCR